MENQNLKFPAICLVNTVNGNEPCCETHAQKLIGLMRFMGSHANRLRLDEPTDCNNCINEAAKVKS
jgi:hypothetical protein